MRSAFFQDWEQWGRAAKLAAAACSGLPIQGVICKLSLVLIYCPVSPGERSRCADIGWDVSASAAHGLHLGACSGVPEAACGVHLWPPVLAPLPTLYICASPSNHAQAEVEVAPAGVHGVAWHCRSCTSSLETLHQCSNWLPHRGAAAGTSKRMGASSACAAGLQRCEGPRLLRGLL